MTSFLLNAPDSALPSRLPQSIEVTWIAGDAETPDLRVRETKGSLAISFCPGKRVGALRRDAKADLQCLKSKHSIDMVVCLLNEAELRSLGLREYGKRVEEEGMNYLVFPVIDMCAPEDPDKARRLIETIAHQYLLGQNILVHCRAGIGRAGMVCACVLLRLGIKETAASAIEHVRLVRHSKAVQTTRQEQFVQWYHKNMHLCNTGVGQDCAPALKRKLRSVTSQSLAKQEEPGIKALTA
eukprot:jgi/Ulvmu1/7872/UM004_0103.1